MTHLEPPTRRLVARFVFVSIGWAVVLSFVAFGMNLLNAPEVLLRPGRWLAFLTDRFSLFVVFGAFAGGIALHAAAGARAARSAAVLGGAIVAAFCFLSSAYLNPYAEYRADTLSERIDVERQNPFGPWTVGARIEHLRYVRANPTTAPSLSVDAPLVWPPGWSRHRFHLLFSMPLVGIIFGLLGQMTAELTDPIRTSRRRHVRWALGILAAGLFIVPASYIGKFARSVYDAPGALTGWAILLVPLAVLAIAWGAAEAQRGLESRHLDRRR